MLKLQQARESFMERLARERKEAEEEPSKDVIKVQQPMKTIRPSGEGLNRKRDFTEEQVDYMGFKHSNVEDNKYNPLSLLR